MNSSRSSSYTFGDVVLIAFPFVEDARVKKRPALVLLDTGDDDVLVARITTRLYQSPYDVKLAEWQAAGLLAPSVVRLHKLATLEKEIVERTLGKITATDSESVRKALNAICKVWGTSSL